MIMKQKQVLLATLKIYSRILGGNNAYFKSVG